MPPRDAALPHRRDARRNQSHGRGDQLTPPTRAPAPAAGGGAKAKREPSKSGPHYASLVLLVDLDGTLVDSEEINHKAFVQIFREFHLEDKIATVFEGLAGGRDFAGIMKDIGLDDATRRLMEKRMEEIVSAADIHLLPGAKEAIRGLRGKGVKFSIVTLNVAKKAREILRRNGMEDLFDPELVVGSDSLPWEKPNPRVVIEVMRRADRSQAMVIGNAPRDVMLAKNCDLPVVYLKETMPSSGAIAANKGALEVFRAAVHDLEKRYDHRKIHMADSWAEIPGIVESVLSGGA